VTQLCAEAPGRIGLFLSDTVGAIWKSNIFFTFNFTVFHMG